MFSASALLDIPRWRSVFRFPDCPFLQAFCLFHHKHMFFSDTVHLVCGFVFQLNYHDSHYAFMFIIGIFQIYVLSLVLYLFCPNKKLPDMLYFSLFANFFQYLLSFGLYDSHLSVHLFRELISALHNDT